MAQIVIRKKTISVGRFSKPNCLTYAQIIYLIKKSKYDEWYASIGGHEGSWNEEVENGPFAPFVDVFYDLFAANQAIPTPKKVCETYAAKYCTDLGDGRCCLKNGFVFQRNHLYGRITRAYCSWCRELTLLYALFEVLPTDSEAYYDSSLDRHGVDIVIWHNNRQYNIHSYLKSYNSLGYRDEKNNRYAAEEGIHINLIASAETTRRVGCVDVHTHENAEWLLSELSKHESTVG